MSTLQYGEIFDKSWQDIRGQLPLVAGLSFLYFLAAAVTIHMPVLGMFVNSFIHAGYVICLLSIRNKNEMGFADFFWAFGDFNRCLQLLVLFLVYNFAIIFGFICLIIPGIYFGVTLSLATSYFITRKQDAMESFKESSRLIKGHWWEMSVLLFLICMLNLAGALCLVVGLLISMPLSVFILLNTLDVLEKKQGALVAGQGVSLPIISTTNKSDF